MGRMARQVRWLEGKGQLDGQDGRKAGWVDQLQGFVTVTRLQDYNKLATSYKDIQLVTRICNGYKATRSSQLVTMLQCCITVAVAVTITVTVLEKLYKGSSFGNILCW